MLVLKSSLLFLLAGLAEIGGGYMMWLWLRYNQPFFWGILGALVLALYGVIPTFQAAHFGRVYAAYGGVFVAMSLAWGWLVDNRRPNLYDIIGRATILMGVGIIMYWPREAGA